MDDVPLSPARVKGLTMIYPHILHHGAIAGVTGDRCTAQSIGRYRSVGASVRGAQAAIVRQPADRRQQSASSIHSHCGWWHVCEHVVDYLKFIQHDSRHSVLFVDCQAQSTTEHSIQVDGSADGYVLLNDVRYNFGAKNIYHYWLPTSKACWIL